jgi:hypothetical protein
LLGQRRIESQLLLLEPVLLLRGLTVQREVAGEGDRHLLKPQMAHWVVPAIFVQNGIEHTRAGSADPSGGLDQLVTIGHAVSDTGHDRGGFDDPARFVESSRSARAMAAQIFL